MIAGRRRGALHSYSPIAPRDRTRRIPVPNHAVPRPLPVETRMNRSARKQHHEQLRKKHKHDQQEHARELAKKKPATTAAWILGLGVAVMVALVLAATFL